MEVHGVVNRDNSIGAEQYILLADQTDAQKFSEYKATQTRTLVSVEAAPVSCVADLMM